MAGFDAKEYLETEEEIKSMAEIIKEVLEKWLDETNVIPQGTSYYAECLCCADDAARLLWRRCYRNIDKNGLKIRALEEQNKFMSEAFDALQKKQDDVDEIKTAIRTILKWVKK